MFLFACSSGHDSGDSKKPKKPPWSPITPIYADNGIPHEPDIINYVPMGDIAMLWQPPGTDILGNSLFPEDQLLFWVYAWRVNQRDAQRKILKELEREVLLEEIIGEDGWCRMNTWLDEDGEWAIGVETVLIRFGIEIPSDINWSDEIANQGAAGLWRVCDPDQMPPKSATELATELAAE